MRGFVYIITNNNNTILYTGVTSDLKDRLIQHKSKKHPYSFSSKYNLFKLVYYECYETIGEAIKREKQIKSGSRKKKLNLINEMNPEWNDVSLFLDGNLRLLRPPASGSQ
jgi:putative endonuclease